MENLVVYRIFSRQTDDVRPVNGNGLSWKKDIEVVVFVFVVNVICVVVTKL